MNCPALEDWHDGVALELLDQEIEEHNPQRHCRRYENATRIAGMAATIGPITGTNSSRKAKKARPSASGTPSKVNPIHVAMPIMIIAANCARTQFFRARPVAESTSAARSRWTGGTRAIA